MKKVRLEVREASILLSYYSHPLPRVYDLMGPLLLPSLPTLRVPSTDL